MDIPVLLLFIFFLSKQFYIIKTVDFSRIRTRISEEAGEHVDHLTTTTALHLYVFALRQQE